MNEEGRKELRGTFEALALMGTKVIVAGVLPRQAKQLLLAVKNKMKLSNLEGFRYNERKESV